MFSPPGITFFYVFGVFALGLVVPSSAPGLLDANRARLSAAASPFVVAANIAGVRTLPSIINGAILMYAHSHRLSFETDRISVSSSLLRIRISTLDLELSTPSLSKDKLPRFSEE